MNYAENNRISHRQLYRQILLSFFAPFLLCLFRERRFLGVQGIVGVLGAVVLLLFYVIFLIRVSPDFFHPVKTVGKVPAAAVGCFFLVYVVMTGAVLLKLLNKTVVHSLISGVPEPVLSFLVILCVSLGTHKGMQRRGRAAEVSGGMFLFLMGLLLLLAAGQGRFLYLKEMPFTIDSSVWRSGYGVLCAFAGVGLLPFALEDVERQSSAGKTVMWAIGTLGGLLVALQLLLPAVFGWERLLSEKYPVLPLLAQADMPGNVLARFDVLWLGFLVYGLLFSLGSLLHYGHQIIRKTELGTGKYWLGAAVFLLSCAEPGRYDPGLWYERYLEYIYLPGMLLIQACFMISGRGRRLRKHGMAVGSTALFLCLLLGGCAGVEPEERVYALAVGVDASKEGFSVTFGLPDMAKATGQEKPEETKGKSITVTGKTLEEIEEKYGASREKIMDVGHLEALVFGKEILGNGKWQQVLSFMKAHPYAGENLYVFCADRAKDVLEWSNEDGSSAGEYLRGLMENNFSGKKKREGITLREVYHFRYQKKKMPELPKLLLEKNQLHLVGGGTLKKEEKPMLAWWGTLYPRFCFSDRKERLGKISFWLAQYIDW